MTYIPELRRSENAVDPHGPFTTDIASPVTTARREAEYGMDWVVRRNGWYCHHGQYPNELRERYPGLVFQS